MTTANGMQHKRPTLLSFNLVQAAVSPVAQRPQQQQQQQQQDTQRQQQQQDGQQEAQQQQQPDHEQPKQAKQAAPAQQVAEAPPPEPEPEPEPIVGEHKSGWAPPPAPQPHELPAPPGDVRAEGSGHEILLQVRSLPWPKRRLPYHSA